MQFTLCYCLLEVISVKIADLIKEARKKAGLTQKELGALVGTSEAMISQYENGHRRPKYTTLETIAKALGIEVDYLYVDAKDRRFLRILCGAGCKIAGSWLDRGLA